MSIPTLVKLEIVTQPNNIFQIYMQPYVDTLYKCKIYNVKVDVIVLVTLPLITQTYSVCPD